MMHHKSIRQVLTILSPSILMRALAMDIFIPCLPAVALEFSSPFATAQWVLSIYMIGAGLGQLVLGPLAEKIGRRPVILASIILFMLSSIACAFASSIYMLIICRLMQGLGACGTTVITVAIVRDLYEDHVTPRIYSYFNAIISIAPLLAPLLGGSLLVLTGNWRTVFYFLTIFSAITLIVNYFKLSETKPQLFTTDQTKLKFFASYKQILTNVDFLTHVYCAITGLTSLFLFFSTSSILLIERLAVPADQYGLYFGANSLVYLAANLISPSLQKRFGTNKVIFWGSSLLVLGSASMLLCNLFSGLTIYGLMLPNAISTFGIGLNFGPCIAGAMRGYKHIAAVASACYGALLYCLSAAITTLIMQAPVYSSANLAITMLVMGSLNIIILSRFLKFDRVLITQV